MFAVLSNGSSAVLGSASKPLWGSPDHRETAGGPAYSPLGRDLRFSCLPSDAKMEAALWALWGFLKHLVEQQT